MTVPPASPSGRHVVPLRPAANLTAAAGQALAAVHRHLARCKLAPNTVKAYRRQTTAYVSWLTSGTVGHPDAFAERWVPRPPSPPGAATSYVTRHPRPRSTRPWPPSPCCTTTLACASPSSAPASPAPANPMPSPPPSRAPPNEPPPAAAPATPPSSPSCSTPEPARKNAHGSTSRTSRSPPAPARSACTAKATRSAPFPYPRSPAAASPSWLDERGRHPGPLWPGQRGPLTISGIVQVVLAVGDDAGIPGLRPHRCRHTYATRLRQGGADPAQVQALLGLASVETAARYFRAGKDETSRHRRPHLRVARPDPDAGWR